MKLNCEKYLLSQAVNTAGRAAASKSPITALEGLLVEAGHNVRITGYDLKRGIYTTFEADVSDPGSIILPAKLFGDIVRKLPDGIVTITADANNAVNIKCGNADYNLMGSDAGDYPELPSMDYSSSVTVRQDVFARMISETSFAISEDELRPVYTGALFDIENDVLTMVAVDGFRLALRREEVEKCDVELASFIVPGAALRDMEKLCTEGEETAVLRVGSKHVSFSVGDTVLISRRLEGEFMNYKKTVPQSFGIRVTAARSEMIRCAERVSLIIDDRSKNPLRCVFGDGELSISCSTPLGRAEDSCVIDGNADGLVIGFNNSYLLDALRAAPADRLRVNLNNGSSPCVLTPEDGSDKFTYMILPVRMRNAGNA